MVIRCKSPDWTSYIVGHGQDVNLFAERIAGSGPIPGLPRMDPNRVVRACLVSHHLSSSGSFWKKVHATQSIEVIKDLPLVSGEGWKITSRITGVVENSQFHVEPYQVPSV